jgi:uncharacterized circularly permuted ATP-grasp superfamily protein
MATTLHRARLSPAAAGYPLDAGRFDEAFAPTGAPRTPNGALLDALALHDLAVLRERVRSDSAALGLTFGEGRPITVDPVPRLIDATEWRTLEAGIVQRARALNAFLADVYDGQRIVEQGEVPRHLLHTSPGYEPRMRGLLDPAVPAATVAGLDLVRDATGTMLVLEDNLRMPSGAAYAIAVRRVVPAALGAAPAPLRLDRYIEALGAALRGAAPDGRGDPAIAILSEGSASGTWFEHRALGEALGVPVLPPDSLVSRRGRLFARIGRALRRVDVLYRRLDDERLSDARGRATALGELLLPALEAGRLRCLNAFGTGVADDKLAHVYVEGMVRFYLGEEPLLRSAPSFDLCDEASRNRAMRRLDELTLKPRDGFGGRDVTILPRASAAQRRRAIGLARRRPEGFVAQETISLSTHPTVCEGRLRPRRVDLRPFAVSGAAGTAVMPGGLTRFAAREDETIVNSSRGGGCKDTWVVQT